MTACKRDGQAAVNLQPSTLRSYSPKAETAQDPNGPTPPLREAVVPAEGAAEVAETASVSATATGGPRSFWRAFNRM